MTPDPFTVGSRQPDWVMCGMPQPGGEGVRLIASKTLDRAGLEWNYFRASQALVDLTVAMRADGIMLIDAPDYPAAFRALFRDWTPGPAERPALGGQRGITA